MNSRFPKSETESHYSPTALAVGKHCLRQQHYLAFHILPKNNNCQYAKKQKYKKEPSI